ncbi:hypothetical protein NPIL_216911 [Nephila pilipes]|uniref:Uncharacterized protein n=1 Tax=Nephila pilipes TaxID=299642 RepID=A0A8X6T0L2_NEPPI|nr:hypothetical protein NPIL_216911 [Nephila pilipes]
MLHLIVGNPKDLVKAGFTCLVNKVGAAPPHGGPKKTPKPAHPVFFFQRKARRKPMAPALWSCQRFGRNKLKYSLINTCHRQEKASVLLPSHCSPL